MRSAAVLCIVILTTAALAQNATTPAPQPEPNSVTVPITLDHNRVVIDVKLPLPDGSLERVRAWVDNGTPELELSGRLARTIGLNLICTGQLCSTPNTLSEILIGDMKIPLSKVKPKIPLKPANAESVAFPGMNAEINIPSIVLRNYDVLIDLPGHKFTIAHPGSLKFNGLKTRVRVNADNGLIQVPSQIENRKYNLGLDLGSSISFIAPDIFDKLSAAHADWPHMTGAIGPGNMWGAEDETKWKLLRVSRVQLGSTFLTGVAAVELPGEWINFFEKRAGTSAAGLLGTNALVNYRIGLDYAHSLVYFEIGRTSNFPDFDVIGIILRPEDDGRFTILAVADFDGKPSVPEGPEGIQKGDHLLAVGDIPTAGSTLGQVWSMLRGDPGQERKLTIERNGKQLAVIAKVQHFLGETVDSPPEKKSLRN